MDAVALVNWEGNIAKTGLHVLIRRAFECFGCSSAQQLWRAGAPDRGHDLPASRPQRRALIEAGAPEACGPRNYLSTALWLEA